MKGSVIQKSASVDFNYNEKHFQKVDFIRAQKLGIFGIMGWIKFLPEKETIQSPGKTNSLHEAILFDHTSDIGKTILREWENPEICCPELVGTNLTVDATCTNNKCGKPVATASGERTVTCMNCNNTMRVKNVSTSLVVCYYLKIFCYHYPQR